MIKVPIYEQGIYESSKGEAIKILEMWHGAKPRIKFQMGDTIYTRSREVFEEGLREGKIIKKLF